MIIALVLLWSALFVYRRPFPAQFGKSITLQNGTQEGIFIDKQKNLKNITGNFRTFLVVLLFVHEKISGFFYFMLLIL